MAALNHHTYPYIGTDTMSHESTGSGDHEASSVDKELQEFKTVEDFKELEQIIKEAGKPDGYDFPPIEADASGSIETLREVMSIRLSQVGVTSIERMLKAIEAAVPTTTAVTTTAAVEPNHESDHTPNQSGRSPSRAQMNAVAIATAAAAELDQIATRQRKKEESSESISLWRAKHLIEDATGPRSEREKLFALTAELGITTDKVMRELTKQVSEITHELLGRTPLQSPRPTRRQV